jgi:hypothetical protein
MVFVPHQPTGGCKSEMKDKTLIMHRVSGVITRSMVGILLRNKSFIICFGIKFKPLPALKVTIKPEFENQMMAT